jgi:hypothetical protein
MKSNVKAPASTIVAIASGVIFLFAYFLDLDLIRQYILSWVTILAAAALLLGLLNLIQVHYKRLTNDKNTVNSSALLISLIATFIITLMFGSNSPTAAWIFNTFILPVETSLLALLSITLPYAALRLFSKKANIYTGIFIFFFILTIASFAPLFGKEIPILQDHIGPWVTTILAGAGVRGILIGVALGTISSGIRVLLGADQPFKD